MSIKKFVRRTGLPVSAQEAFAFHQRPGAFERLVAPWRPVKLVSSSNGIHDGSLVTIAAPLGPLRLPWIFEHRGYKEGKEFQDFQLSGPFASWQHIHKFIDEGDSSFLEDEVTYELPLGALGDKINSLFFENELDRLFRYRHNITVHDLGVHSRFHDRPRLSFLIAGGSGLIGSALTPFLTSGGHKVARLRRTSTASSETIHTWDPSRGSLPQTALLGSECVIHLGGTNIASSRWTDSVKQKIFDSRIKSTRLLSETLAKMPNPPRTFICASAIGYYGNRPNEDLTEHSSPGNSFLAEVTQAWEAATAPASEAGIRVVNMRLGMVLSPLGGALSKMWRPFSFGLGGPLGTGKQYISWISLHDLLAVIEHIAYTESISGPVNVSSPYPVTNEEFSSTFARALARPCALRIPKAALDLLLGEMAEEMLLSSARANPEKLLHSGFTFSLPTLDDAIRMDLGMPGSRV